MDKKIHVPTPNEGGERIERELDDIEREFYQVLVSSVCEHMIRFILYMALIGLGAFLAFYFLRAYAEREEAYHG